jgi:hypothetical protein
LIKLNTPTGRNSKNREQRPPVGGLSAALMILLKGQNELVRFRRYVRKTRQKVAGQQSGGAVRRLVASLDLSMFWWNVPGSEYAKIHLRDAGSCRSGRGFKGDLQRAAKNGMSANARRRLHQAADRPEKVRRYGCSSTQAINANIAIR